MYKPNYVKVRTHCVVCGKEVEIETLDWMAEMYGTRGMDVPYACPPCDAAREAKRIQKEDEEWAREEARQAAIRLEQSAIPEEYRVLLPPVPAVAAWIEKNIGRNILLHGFTGAGKSTSAGYHARIMVNAGKRVKWYALAGLLDEWRQARKSDDANATQRLFNYLESFDVLILDECDKPVSTESTQELMFRLIEEVSNGTSHAKVWMLGNFYRGSIEDIFGNGEAARRRFNEKFACGQIVSEGIIKRIKL